MIQGDLEEFPDFPSVRVLSIGMIRRPNPIAVLNTDSRPTNICGHSEEMSRTAQTNRYPPAIIMANPLKRNFQLLIFYRGGG